MAIQYDHLILIVAAIIVALKIEGQTTDVTRLYNTCLHDRVADEHQIPYKFVSHVIWNSSKLLIGGIVLALALWHDNPTEKRKINWRATYLGTYNILWYSCWYPILSLLKTELGDNQCGGANSRHMNSISGHYAFHVFQLLSVLYLFVSLKRSPRDLYWYFNSKLVDRVTTGRIRPRTKILLALYALFVLLSCWTMYRTWAWGYHSLRQIYNGVLFALFIHYIEVHFLLQSMPRPGRSPRLTRLHLILVLFVLQGCALSVSYLYDRVKPYESIDIAVFIGAWLLLLFSYAKDAEHSFFVPQSQLNRQRNE